MKFHMFRYAPILSAMSRRAMTIAGLSLLGLAAALPGVQAQSPNDITSPTPYSWPMFHAGGTSPGIWSPSFPNASPNLLMGQLQGTPSGVYFNPAAGTTMLTETPSFLLGNYQPKQPPGSQTVFTPSNFRDALPFRILSWSSPFTFLIPTGSLDNPNALQVDDTTDGTTPNPAVTLTPPAAWDNAGTPFADGTATNGEFLLHSVVQSPLPATATATWSLTAPAAGFYALTFHIPDVPLNNTQVRIQDAHYVVSSNGQTLADVHISQTDANASQNLAGPFFLAASQIVTVKLDNTTKEDPTGKIVVADSVSLQPGFGADTQSQPTAVDSTHYPEIRDALYYGVLPANDPARNPFSANPNTDPSLPDSGPRGNPTEGTLNPDPNRRIRQLVYFGRSENIVLQDTSGNLQLDANGQRIVSTVGAIYCVDGFTGSVVWRYQTPVVQALNTDGSLRTLKPSAPVFSAPAVARINVVTGTTPSSPGNPAQRIKGTKLVVIVGDDNGMVYCLDALGNRNGTCNLNSVSNGQPVFNPTAGLNSVSVPRAHVGTTPLYWIYRPDPANPIRDGQLHTIKPGDPAVPARDLPVPQAFGLASPTVYINPAANANAVGLPPSNPGVVGSPLKSNATVYIGNSNGTLYSLDALGGVEYSDTSDPNPPGVRFLFNQPLPIGELGPLGDNTGSNGVLTCSVNWWFATNGSSTNTTDDNNVAIVSAPAIWETDGATGTAASQNTTITPAKVQHIYFATANDPLNEGRLYSLTSDGPVDQTNASVYFPNNVGGPSYNVNAEPDWAFPQLEHQFQTLPFPAAKTRPTLGSMTGSPVVFLNPHDVPPPPAIPPPFPVPPTEPTIYIAAASGVEEPGQDRPGVEESGRIWGLKASTGVKTLAYPDANDPNDPSLDKVDQPSLPVGTFRHVTPAIGMVQFPSSILFGANVAYTHTDSQGTFTANGGSNGPIVPMLYAGSAGVGSGQLGPRFYGLDLDGIGDKGLTIFKEVLDPPANANGPDDPNNYVPGIASPGDAFQTSPALIVNSSSLATGAGNGGAIFAAAGSTLYQFSATPETAQDNTSTQPIFPALPLDAGFGPITSPSVAAADVSDLEILTGPLTAPVPQTTDWVYFGDRGLGITFGITPKDQGNGVGETLGNGVVPPNPVPIRIVLPQFPLYSYLFDGTATHPGGLGTPPPATTADGADMSKANPIGGALPVFEWGQNVYVRIGNVVPPFPAADATGALNPQRIVDPDEATIFFADGGPVSIQISEFDPTSNQANQTDSGQVPATVLTALPGNGFIRRTDPVVAAPPPPHFLTHLNEQLIDASGAGWIGAYTYAVRDGSGRKNTPGSTRRVINAVQTAKAYQLVTDSNGNPVLDTNGNPTFTFLQTVTLQTTITAGGQYTATITRNTDGSTQSGTIGRISAVDQPTFALLNPLAANGGGVPLFANSGVARQIGVINRQTNAIDPELSMAGPFAGVHAAGSATPDDLPAYTNGNRTYRDPAGIPNSGVRGARRGGGRLVYHRVTTAAGEINHGTTGDNKAPGAPSAPTGTLDQGIGGLANPNVFGEYMLDVADRSVLGLNGQHLQITMESHNAHWNDNSGAGGPGAVVNPLPWERMPAQYGPNSSLDYPNVPRRNVTQVVLPFNPNNAAGIGGPATNLAVVPDPATANGANPATRFVYADPVQVKIDVPRFQSANLQLYDQDAGGGITPENADPNHNTYPMGYVSRRQRVYVDSNHNGRYDDGEAYRFLFTYVGVPVDMNTTIETSTVDLGKLPQSLGIQTDAFAPLNTFMPYTLPLGGNYPARFRSFFKPLDIRNRGNVNLLNVHLDQKIIAPGISGNTLPLVSDALDSQAFIPAYDYNGALTGPRPNGVAPFLLRSSLDTDLVTAFGRNPGIVNNFGAMYPGATFHKAQVISGQPTQLTVPDVPNSNVPGSPYALLPNPTPSTPLKVNAAGNQLVWVNAANVPFPATAVPFIGLAVPLGTPVGTYSQRFQLFEGIDPQGYHDIGQGGTYTPLLSPKYGGVQISVGGNPPGALDDTWRATIVRTGSTPSVVKGTVTEARVTDGTTFGTLPHLDPVNAGPRGVADFQPSAFRNVFWNGSTLQGDGSLGLVWTTSRGFNSAAAPPYNIAGAVLPFTAGYFDSTKTVGNDSSTRWWKLPAVTGTNPNGLLFNNVIAPPNGVSTGMTFATDQQLPNGSGAFQSDGSVYAFVQNVVSGAGSQSQILCYPVVGGIVDTTTPALVTRDPGPAKSGVRGLKFSNTTFSDAFNAPGTINNNLWAFWGGGTRGRSAISYSSAVASGTTTPAFDKSAVLPIPAGLVSVSDPSAVLIYVPNGTTPNPIPVIEVTYTGISPDGNADIYVSRYQPYYVRDARNQPTAQVGLALIPSPLINGQLQADPGNLYWQARDVGWLRTNALNVVVGNGPNSSLLLDPANGNLRATVKQTFDRATGSLVYTNVAVPLPNNTTVVSTVYLDLARGRVRFSPALTSAQAVFATFYAQARRITTDSRADTTPLAFLDPTYKPNEAAFFNDSRHAVGLASVGNDIPRVQTDRYWYIWRKSGSSGTSTTPTLYYKTQRLTVGLVDGNNRPVSLRLDAERKPIITVSLGGTITGGVYSGGVDVYTEGSGGPVDVDWVRGRVYFPMLLNGAATEGQNVHITATTSNGGTVDITDQVHWLDEPRSNDLTASRAAVNPTQLPAVSTNDAAIPIDTITNESNVSAFLDPMAFADVLSGAYDPTGSNATTNNRDQPHKLWLFWNSTRNGTADIYYETIEPKFSASPGT